MSHEMICICDPDGLAEAEKLRLGVQQRLGVPAEKLAVASLLSLAWEFGAKVAVYADQWFGVEIVDGDKRDFVACDLPLDGICYMWKLLAERHERGPAFYIDNLAIALSESQLKAASSADTACDEHKKSCTACDWKNFKLCPDGKSLWEAMCETSQVVSNKWGMPDFDAAPYYWGGPVGA